jgi:cytochrome c biogenesis protein CcmG/thiol:disulfide interchange protein DsbE
LSGLARAGRPPRCNAGRRQALAALAVAIPGAAASARATPAPTPTPAPAWGGGSSAVVTALAAQDLAPAPDFDLPVWDLTGNAPHPSRRLALPELRGRWVYLDFWASWCGPCRLSFPWMNDLEQRMGGHGLSVVAIGLDTRAEPMARFLAQFAPRFTVLWDARHATPGPYQVRAMPSSFVVDPQGRIVTSHRGFTPTGAQAVERDLRQRLGLA